MVFLGDDRAALTAAIYAARAGLEPLVFETMALGGDEAWDGEQACSDDDDQNRRGGGVRDAMRAQATKSGAAFHPRDDPVSNVDLSKHPFAIETRLGVVVPARTLVVSETLCESYAELSLSLKKKKNETTESTTTPGAFVARGSGFAAGVAAERWHGPVERSRDLSKPNPIGTAFAVIAKKTRAAVSVADESRASPFVEAERLSAILPGAAADENVAKSSGPKKNTADVFPFDPKAVRHRGADAFRRLYAGESFFGDSPREKKKVGETRGDVSGGEDEKKNVSETTKTFALIAFFGAEGCAPCARVRPMLASVVDEYDRDRVRFVEMDVEADADMADALGVAGTPFVLFYRVEVGRRKQKHFCGGGDETNDDETDPKKKAGSQNTDAVAVERVAAVVGGKTKRAYRDALDAILGEDARVDGPRRRFA